MLSTRRQRLSGQPLMLWLLAIGLVVGASASQQDAYAEDGAVDSPAINRVGTSSMRADVDAVTIPFSFYGENLLVEGTMGGVPVKMLIDNGVLWDELWFYSSALPDSLGIAYEDSTHIEGSGEGSGIDSYSASGGITISFGDISFHDQPAIITPEEQGIAALFPGIDGQICGTFFKNFVVEFDFDRQVLILHEPDSYVYTGGGSSIRMTRDESASYSIPVGLETADGTPVDTRLFIDLGGVFPVSLTIDEKAGLPRPDSERILLGYGASGEINGYKGQLKSLTIGAHELDDVAAVFTESPTGADFTNTTIGLPALRRFNVVFDYFRGILYVEPNSHFAEPFAD